MGRKARLLHRLFAVLLFLSVSVLAWSMLAGTFPEKEVTQGDSPARRLIAERVKKQMKLMAKERRSGFKEALDLKYVSRRRIPTGPDPIHNRRVVMRVPPGF